jgi:Small primase-like proteins (Toprim domain)
MIRVEEAIIVEGKYDKIKLSSLVDGVIIETDGFGIFKNKEKIKLIQRLAQKNGIIVLTDSDAAGFQIRGKLSSVIPKEQIKHAYIPDLPGKEKRKKISSKEGKLGVEGIDIKLLEKILLQAGKKLAEDKEQEKITKANFYEMGLTGKPQSAQLRKKLVKWLDLPEHISVNSLLQIVNKFFDKEEFCRLFAEVNLTSEITISEGNDGTFKTGA